MEKQIKKLKLDSKILKRTIDIIIVLPENFKNTNDYSTYLVFDGNNLIGSENNILQHKSDKIMIGISCLDDIDRFNSWSTYDNQAVVAPMSKKFPEITGLSSLGGNGEKYNQFITTELLVFLQAVENLKIKDLNLLGCSMGAYFSLQMLYLNQTITFKRVLLFSPSIWFNKQILQDLTTKKLNNNQSLNIMLWVGLKEPKLFEKTFPINYYQDVLSLKAILETKNQININLIVDENGAHGFKWWINYLNSHHEIW